MGNNGNGSGAKRRRKLPDLLTTALLNAQRAPNGRRFDRAPKD